jgi:hypothetical protein
MFAATVAEEVENVTCQGQSELWFLGYYVLVCMIAVNGGDEAPQWVSKKSKTWPLEGTGQSTFAAATACVARAWTIPRGIVQRVTKGI